MTTLLETRHLTVKIAHKTICRDLHLQIKSGEFWGILGSNGSGKTTLLHVLAGLHPISHGSIHLINNNMTSYSRKEIATKLAILFQDTQFSFPQTVLEFCQSGRYPHHTSTTEDENIIHSALRIMELEQLATHNVQTLSGGEKRRLAIAAVITQTPQIYLLDEPTNHLDLRHQMQMLQYFKTSIDISGVVMAIHDINIAQRFCSHILMLCENGVTLHGKANDMLTEKNLSQLYQFPIKSLHSTWIPDV